MAFAIGAQKQRLEELGLERPRLRVNVVGIAILIVFAAAGIGLAVRQDNPAWLVLVLVGFLLAQSPKVARQWERAVVLKLGRFIGPFGVRVALRPARRGADAAQEIRRGIPPLLRVGAAVAGSIQLAPLEIGRCRWRTDWRLVKVDC